jgi:hypothetical protein
MRCFAFATRALCRVQPMGVLPIAIVSLVNKGITHRDLTPKDAETIHDELPLFFFHLLY